MTDWYKSYLEKKDILASLPNNYIEAQVKEKSELKPYYIVKIVYGRDDPIQSLKDKRVWAYSPAQARFKFLDLYAHLRDYLGMGMEVEARFDAKGWKAELEKREKQRVNIDTQKQEDEERIRDMWWNND